MKISYGEIKTKFGPGVDIVLDGNEVASAIRSYLVAHDVNISGASTVTVNDRLCNMGRVYVDPSGFVVSEGIKFSGRGQDG